ncbi:hypothetical protein [Methylomonas koyamae]|uniref:hypothetical protein n=1 Tax=Methylomonas koyamae TaxID=702114 RepID=UPI0006D1A76A|nr:hypothetical protein [Methylomonas koyamae]WNB75612.1 hypothetical protein RI210_20390 [Methylomonas koyamae]BBL60397.1 hypothetical protein MKFW12EY_40100 [Methylomonas koyamae]
MAKFTNGFQTNHIRVFAPSDNKEKLIDEAVKRLNDRSVRANSTLVVSSSEAQQILAHCDSLAISTRETVVEIANTVSYGIVADRRNDQVTVYKDVKFKYIWGWASQRNVRQIFHLEQVSIYTTIEKTIKKSYVEDFPALG